MVDPTRNILKIEIPRLAENHQIQGILEKNSLTFEKIYKFSRFSLTFSRSSPFSRFSLTAGNPVTVYLANFRGKYQKGTKI